MRFPIPFALLLVGALLGGCNTEYAAFEEAKTANTPEAYRAFLDEYPEAMNKALAEERLDNLEWKAAEAENTAEAYEAYMAAHPAGRHATDAELAAPKLAWVVADYSGDGAVVQTFIDKYGHSAYGTNAKQRLALLELVPAHLEIGPAKLTEAGKNKWTVTADVKNVGQLPVITAEFRIGWRDADGRITRSKEWYLVVEKSDRYDAADELVNPLAPGEMRTFSFTFRRSEATDDWVADQDHIQIGIVDLKLAEAAP